MKYKIHPHSLDTHFHLKTSMKTGWVIFMRSDMLDIACPSGCFTVSVSIFLSQFTKHIVTVCECVVIVPVSISLQYMTRIPHRESHSANKSGWVHIEAWVNWLLKSLVDSAEEDLVEKMSNIAPMVTKTMLLSLISIMRWNQGHLGHPGWVRSIGDIVI